MSFHPSKGSGSVRTTHKGNKEGKKKEVSIPQRVRVSVTVLDFTSHSRTYGYQS